MHPVLRSLYAVCLSSVTLVHPTQPVEIFGNVSTPFGTLAGDCPRGTPPTPGLNARGVAKYSNFGPIEGYILETVQDREVSQYTSLSGMSYMSFRLVLKSVTLNDLERPNGPYFALFHRIW